MATVTYLTPVAGTTPPTAAQAFYANMLIANVLPADADTTILITHNWSLTTAQQAAGFPVSVFAITGVGTAASSTGHAIVQTSNNAVSLQKTTTSAGSGVGWTIQIILQRPHSIIT